LEENAGLDPAQDRYFCGYIAAYNDILRFKFVEETEESEDD
jgi:hypothetical protein